MRLLPSLLSLIVLQLIAGAFNVSTWNSEIQGSKKARRLHQEPGPERDTILVDGQVYLRINRDPPVPEEAAAGHDRVRVKTRLCRPQNAQRFAYCTHPSNATYPLPITHSVRTVDDLNRIPKTAMFCNPHGIGGYADWVYVSCPEGLFGSTLRPKVIYVHTKLLDAFVENVLPHLSHPFVLVSATNDYTIPINFDLRYGDRNTVYMKAWKSLLASHKVIHWFVENHFWNHPKVSTLPIGASMREDSPDYPYYPTQLLPFNERSSKLIVTDKVRRGEQWEDRRAVAKACSERPDNCELIGGLISHVDWARRVSEHQFTVCTHGGGLDPSPKAWESIKIGTIPIVEEMPLIDAYSHLPIAWVKDLKAFMRWENISAVQKEWIRELGPFYETNSLLRTETLHKLTGRYWNEQIRSHLSRDGSN